MNIEPLLVSTAISIIDAIEKIDANRLGVVILVDENRRMLGVVTDGDIRRAILAGLDMNQSVSVLLERRAMDLYPEPVSGRTEMTDAAYLELMTRYKIRHLPIVDDNNRLVDLILLDNLTTTLSEKFTAVIMAGGFGTRLRPLTNDLPKPMLPIMGKPILERQIIQLKESGITKITITTHYKHNEIADYFGDGTKYGVTLKYVREKQPLGTAGALGMIDLQSQPLLVINGDILTRVNFLALSAFHEEHNAEMTVAVREYSFQVPFGVVKTDGVFITSIEEKPFVNYFVNAGIYIVTPKALQYIPRTGKRFDMTNLIENIIQDKLKVVSFPIREYWLDIGGKKEYYRAQDDFENGRL